MKDNQIFKGVFSALVTPLTADGRINVDAVSALVEHQLAAGLDGFYVCGGTGEGVALTEAQRRQMTEAAIAANKGRGRIVVHVGAMHPKEAFALAEHARECGADGVSSIPPSIYFSYTEDETVDYYQTLASHARLPLLVYRTASLNAGNMLSLMCKLLKSDYICGLKYTGLSYYEMWKFLQLNEGNINVVNGADETLLCGFVTGAQAGIGAVYNLIPEVYVRLYRAFQAGDIKEAKRCQDVICGVIASLGRFIRGAGIILPLKEALNGLGFNVGLPAYPVQGLPQDVHEQLMAAFNQASGKF